MKHALWLRLPVFLLLAATTTARAAEFFVAPTGSDGDPGTIEKPFATLRRAQDAAAPGDTVRVRGGTYVMSEAQVARRKGIFAYVTVLDKSGAPDKRIKALDGLQGGGTNHTKRGPDRGATGCTQPVNQRPFTAHGLGTTRGTRCANPGLHPGIHQEPESITGPIRTSGPSSTSPRSSPPAPGSTPFYVSGSWLHIRGLEVVGVQVTIKGHTQSIGFENDGGHNVFERLSIHDGQAIGLYSVRRSDNLFLNCDAYNNAYNNHDVTSEGGQGGNVDGFGCHPPAGGTGNVFRGCRAWFNSDDGFDCIGAREPVTFENCWAMYNGYSPKFERLADGNGFKAGGYGTTTADRLPRPVPRHTVRFCLAVGNKASGFYANHHPGGSDWFNNTGYRNGTDFNMLCRLADNRTDVDGYGHTLRNNVGYKGRAVVSRLDPSKCETSHNSFTLGLDLRDGDFVSLDERELIRPRQANGDLPAVGFLHPAPGSMLIDRGVDVGFPFHGVAPDLGAFER